MIWLLAGMQNSVVGGEVQQPTPATSAQTAREWTNASGSHRARATLLRVEGDKIWLLAADGRIVTTSVSALSESDRQYIAKYRSSLTSPRTSNSETRVRNTLDQLPAVKRAKAWFQTPQGDTPPRIVPAAMVYVRLSREFIEDYVERTVSTRKPVRDCILGTRIFGQSQTVGKTDIKLLPSRDKISGEIGFHGTVHSRTTGYNGPAILHYKSRATFRARKLVTLGEAGLKVAPATAVASTKLETTGIQTTLPRLRGRIATRIAARRNANSRPEAEAITSRHAAATIEEDFDRRIDRSVAKIKRVFQLKVPGLDMGSDPQIAHMRYRSTPEYVEMAMIRDDASAEEYALRPPPVTGDPDFAIRVNRNLFGTAIADSDFSQQLGPLVVQLLEARFVDKAIAIVAPGAKPTKNPTNWSIDRNWLSMEFTDTDRQQAQATASQVSAK
jgi:hypothetical protein